jgi:hypothetical protein
VRFQGSAAARKAHTEPAAQRERRRAARSTRRFFLLLFRARNWPHGNRTSSPPPRRLQRTHARAAPHGASYISRNGRARSGAACGSVGCAHDVRKGRVMGGQLSAQRAAAAHAPPDSALDVAGTRACPYASSW